MTLERTTFQGGGRLIIAGLVSFAAGLVGLVVGGVTAPRQAFFSYLSAYAFAVSIAVGALIFLMIVHAMNATWPTAIRRIPESITGILPLLALGFIPLVFGLRALYPWAGPLDASLDHETHRLLLHKQSYLKPSAFYVRAAVYFAIWIAIATLLRRWSISADREPARAEERKRRLRVLSALGLPPVAFALTFGSFDWLMSLTPTWYSTMYGVYWFAGGFLTAIALTTLFTWGAQRGGLLERVNSSHYYALGRLLLAFTIFWAYAAFFQFFLIWIADKPAEATWYAVRMAGPWRMYSVGLAIAHFALPFFALLPYGVKRRPAALAGIAAWLVLVHWLDMQWLVMPAARPEGPVIHWLDVAALLCVGGAALAFGTYRLRGEAIIPRNDPALEAAFGYESV
jgi:hypothetical protein